MGKRYWILLLLIIPTLSVHSQEIIPQVDFRRDSVKIGEAVEVAFWVKYSREKQIVLPDSNFNYSPFEFVDKTYYPTRVDSIFAYDSVIYQLSTFEIDPVQYLKLPAYLLASGDSIELLSNTDSIYLQEMIQVVPDSLAFRENVAFVATSHDINYPYIVIGIVVFTIILIVVWIVFGEKIRSKIKLYRLKKDFEKFNLSLERGISDIRQNEKNHHLVEEILVLWKKYMERLEDRPFTKYTSKEIVTAGYGEELKNILTSIDSAIYGNVSDEKMHENFESLEDYTLERYMLKVKEVQNG